MTTAGDQPGGHTCNETWLITSQTGTSFAGAFQRSPGSAAECAVSGTVNGTVSTAGDIAFNHGNTGINSTCVLLGGDSTIRGVLSSAGNITSGAIVLIRCTAERATLDYRFTTSVVLSRR